MRIDLERFKKLRRGTPHYDGCLESIVKELTAARKVVEVSRTNISIFKKLLEKADIDLVVDVNGAKVVVDVTKDILEEISKYDDECGGVDGV